MNEFDQVLEECLLDLERGASNLDQCLARYPKHAAQLRPILLTNAYLEGGHAVMLSPAFKARVRARLTREMQAYPRRGSGFTFAFLRLAAGFAVLVLALLVTGTAYAQRALPGDFLYTWKLTSEDVWRAISPDPVETDLVIAQRRVDELIAVGNNPQAQKNYLETVARLKSEMDATNQAQILSALEAQLQKLKQSGISLPAVEEDMLPSLPAPTLAVPAVIESTSHPTITPMPTERLPQIMPTELPQIVPTSINPIIEVPTVPVPTLGLPTLPIPLPAP